MTILVPVPFFSGFSYTTKMTRLCYGYFVLAIARIFTVQKLKFWLKLG
ncbi:hypothetical protein [Pseudanabaena yagii]|uniref:Uncharacterized protein n=1 Tax=Pseudanabaena yagii GIHE-NHR1 TaxID=2722753 RepID=A0ABX1LKN5_9CYAN|nr:hypothetical protein [Pseudanabaena yagii]NMF56663.1 hypothetical protein [Pseudanabaena yagii GIHE-NHR1]